VSSLKRLKSSGTAGLDRAAREALSRSHLMPLPDDYHRSSVTMQVSFYYNESPMTGR